MPELNEKYDKLCILAEHYKVPIEANSDQIKLQEQYVEVKKKVDSLQKLIDAITAGN